MEGPNPVKWTQCSETLFMTGNSLPRLIAAYELKRGLLYFRAQSKEYPEDGWTFGTDGREFNVQLPAGKRNVDIIFDKADVQCRREGTDLWTNLKFGDIFKFNTAKTWSNLASMGKRLVDFMKAHGLQRVDQLPPTWTEFDKLTKKVGAPSGQISGLCFAAPPGVCKSYPDSAVNLCHTCRYQPSKNKVALHHRLHKALQPCSQMRAIRLLIISSSQMRIGTHHCSFKYCNPVLRVKSPRRPQCVPRRQQT